AGSAGRRPGGSSARLERCDGPSEHGKDIAGWRGLRQVRKIRRGRPGAIRVSSGYLCYHLKTHLAPVADCGLWLGKEGPDRRGDDFGLAAAVGGADVGGATVIKAAEYCAPVVREGAGEGVEGGPDEGRPFHVPAYQQDVGADVGESGDGSGHLGDQQRFIAQGRRELAHG